MIRRLTFFTGIVALLAGVETAGAASDGTAVVNSFYKWYFSVNTTKAGWTGRFSEARPYLTSSLYALIAKVIAKEKSESAAILDFDPFVNAQEPAKSYSVGSASSSKSPANVPVTLRFAAGQGHLTVVVRQSSSWQIDNFVYGSQGNLRSMIAAALK